MMGMVILVLQLVLALVEHTTTTVRLFFLFISLLDHRCKFSETSGNVQTTNGHLDDSGTPEIHNEGSAQHLDSQPTGSRARKAPTRGKARAPKRGRR
jgi:hypothetical protein